MITLKQLAYEAIRVMTGADVNKDTPYDIQYLIRAARQVLPMVVKMQWFEKRQFGDRGPIGMYIVSYKAAVTRDDDREQYYVELPEFYQSLPYNGGLYDINKVNKTEESFIRLNTPHVSADMQMTKMKKVVFYYTEGFRAYFLTNVKDMNLKQVLIKIISPGADDVGVDDALPILADQQVEVISAMVNMYQNRQPEDKLNDDNPDSMLIKK